MSKFQDLTGQIRGFLYVIERLPNLVQPNGRTRTMWLTLCLLCGTIQEKRGDQILYGHNQSCGCYKNKLSAQRMSATKGTHKKNSRSKDLTGMIFCENVLVIRKAENIGRRTAWECECLLCGTHFNARANHLLRNLIASCGCVKSHGERKIRKILNSYNVKYETEYWFSDLVNPETGHVLYFDFAFLDEENNVIALLEFQGEGHDKNIKRYANNPFGRQQREETDPIKKMYCKCYEIPLYEIWYYQNIEEELDKIIKNVLHVNPVPSGLMPEG